MTHKLESCLLYGALTILATFSGICATAIYHEKIAVLDDHEEITKSLQKEASTNKFDYMSKTYQLQIMMDSKLNDLMLSAKDNTNNLALLANKVDTYQQDFLEEKKFTRDRFRQVAARFINVEKNVATIARQKKVSLLGWEYGYGDE